MKRKKYNSLMQLYHKTPLYIATISLIHKHLSYRKIQKFLAQQKFPVSLTVIEGLVKKYQYAKKYNIPLPRILDRRHYNKRKKSIKDVAKAGRLHFKGSDPEVNQIVRSSFQNASQEVNHLSILPRNHFYADREVLDMQIDQYRNALQAHDLDKDATRAGLKAIEIELKYSGDDSLSLEAIKQYELINQAHLQAISQVAQMIMSHKQHQQFLKQVSKVEQQLMKELQISSDGKRLYHALKHEGVKIE